MGTSRHMMLLLAGVALAPACAQELGPGGDGRSDGGGDPAADQAGDGAGCPPGEVRCDGLCVDVSASHANCGACGVACRATEVCDAGRCSLECPGGKVSCDATCVDTGTSTDHCGSCGSACPPPAGLHAVETCDGGVCAERCEAGWSDPGGDGDCEAPCASASAETCNGEDDDCDGRCDNGMGMACCRGASGSCTTGCGSTGTRTCSDACVWGACAAPAETCNGADDDCDTVCDDGYACCAGAAADCTTRCGSTGTAACSASCARGSCELPAESCNGEDDDCDGRCDNGFPCCRGEDDACATSCGSTGSRTCSSSCGWGACAAPAETCNGIDDDCDGQSDEGSRALLVATTYAAVSAYHPSCNGTTERAGIRCNGAIHDWCAARGCTIGGFGPNENSGGNLDVTCVAGARDSTVTWATLATHQPCCTSSVAISDCCSSAVHRYCRAEGFAGGFGPVKNLGASALLTCVTGATVETTTYTHLGTHVPECTEAAIWGSSCNAAIKRHCRADGHESGFGPVEHFGDSATIVCVDP